MNTALASLVTAGCAVASEAHGTTLAMMMMMTVRFRILLGGRTTFLGARRVAARLVQLGGDVTNDGGRHQGDADAGEHGVEARADREEERDAEPQEQPEAADDADGRRSVGSDPPLKSDSRRDVRPLTQSTDMPMP